jgi:hypothetical protein
LNHPNDNFYHFQKKNPRLIHFKYLAYCKLKAFSFSINNFQFSPDDCDRVLIVEQIKWEVWAMMTQPWLFSNHTETTFRHLENLKEVALVVEPQGELATQIESLSVYMQEVLSIS